MARLALVFIVGLTLVFLFNCSKGQSKCNIVQIKPYSPR